MKPNSIKPGGIYQGGKKKLRRQVILIFLDDDPKLATVRYVMGDNNPKDISLASFASWAKRKVGMGPLGGTL